MRRPCYKSQIQAKSQFCAVCPYMLLTQHGVKRTSCEQHGVLFAHAELRNRLFQRRFRDRRQRTTLALPRRDGELTRAKLKALKNRVKRGEDVRYADSRGAASAHART